MFVAFISSFISAIDLSYNVQIYNKNAIFHYIVDTITIIYIVFSTIEYAKKEDHTKALIYGIVLALLAYTIPMIFFGELHARLCEECPPNGLMSISIVFLLILYIIGLLCQKFLPHL